MPGAEHPLCIGSDTWPGLAKLGEESSELGQVIGKITAFPFTVDHPDGTNLRTRIEDEIGDVMAAVSFVVTHPKNALDVERIDARCREKFDRFTRWDAEARERRERS